MKNLGYIALHRKIRDNFLWKEKRSFSKAEAWLDILMEAQHNHEPQQVVIGMTSLTSNYGESLKSLLTWSKRWKWLRSKVVRFLNLLKNEHMVELKTEQVTTRITVCNYSRYNNVRTPSGQLTNINRTTTEQRPNTDNNVNNEKNEKNGNCNPSFSSENKIKTFSQIRRKRAQAALQAESRRFLESGAK